jgi:hypothetical protein
MTTEQAWKIVGNQSKAHIANMVNALTWMRDKTPEEKERLEAGKIALRTNNPRYAS